MNELDVYIRISGYRPGTSDLFLGAGKRDHLRCQLRPMKRGGHCSGDLSLRGSYPHKLFPECTWLPGNLVIDTLHSRQSCSTGGTCCDVTFYDGRVTHISFISVFRDEKGDITALFRQRTDRNAHKVLIPVLSSRRLYRLLSLPTPNRTMPLNAEVTTFLEFDLNDLQRVSRRPPRTIELVEPNPKWASSFVLIAQRIQAALGSRALLIQHVGSTSVPDLPAKDVIDVDLVVANPGDEGDYVQDLEDAGFQFLFREPKVPIFSASATTGQALKADFDTAVVRASFLWP